jgi:plastocyanin
MADVIKMLDTGLSIITNRINGTGTRPNFIGWGIGTTAALVTDSGLESASAEARTSATTSQQTVTTSGDTFRVVGSIACATASKAITEVALFDAETSGNAFMRATFDAINVNVGDSIQFTINTVFDQSA